MDKTKKSKATPTASINVTVKDAAGSDGYKIDGIIFRKGLVSQVDESIMDNPRSTFLEVVK